MSRTSDFILGIIQSVLNKIDGGTCNLSKEEAYRLVDELFAEESGEQFTRNKLDKLEDAVLHKIAEVDTYKNISDDTEEPTEEEAQFVIPLFRKRRI